MEDPQTAPCPICKAEASLTKDFTECIHHYECLTCGAFAMIQKDVEDIFSIFRTPCEECYRVSAFTRERGIHSPIRAAVLLLLSEPPRNRIPAQYAWITFDEIINNRFPGTFSERCNRGLLNLARLSTSVGDDVTLSSHDYPVLLARHEKEMRSIVKVFEKRGYIKSTTSMADVSVALEGDGWDRVAELEEEGRSAGCKQVFVAMWFSEELDRAYEQGFSPAIDECRFTPRKINLLEHNEYVPIQIIAEIRKSRFLVADMTGQRSGVYFEAGFALGLGIPVIWTCRKDEIDKCHFDTKQFSHILWESPEDLKTKLVNRIRATIV